MFHLVLLTLSLVFSTTLSFAQTETSYFIYTVKEEDKSLWGICQQHNVLLEEVKSLNGLTRNGVRAGDQLKIPKQTQIITGEGFITHFVSKQDKNLWRICQKYAVTVEEVQEMNQLSSTSIKVGDVLRIPSTHLIIHSVTSSDRSLWRICKNYGVDLSDLKEFNDKRNNLILRNEKILIPKEWITKPEILNPIVAAPKPGQSMWESLGKPVFDLAKNEDKFRFKEKKQFRINPKLLKTLAVRHKLDSLAYVQLYQQTTQRNDLFYNAYNYKALKKMYYYSIEAPFVMDLTSLDYHRLEDKENRPIEHGYAYDFITIIEVDSAKNSIEILPVFLYKDHFGKVDDYFGKPSKGAFSCCASAHPLAHYSKNKEKEVLGFSELLTPSVLKYTEVSKRLQGSNIVQVDSTILILQLETFDIPSLIDIEEYKNGKLIQPFARAQRRKKLGY